MRVRYGEELDCNFYSGNVLSITIIASCRRTYDFSDLAIFRSFLASYSRFCICILIGLAVANMEEVNVYTVFLHSSNTD